MATVTAPIRMMSRGRVAVTDLAIENAADNMRALAAVEKLMCRARSPEEDALLKVLNSAIESFETKAYPALGKSHVSEILSGKRPIGIKQAAKLGKHFNISPAAFIRFT
jgi:antitoxin component HigA of HigAB toxin-antitoxin module